MEPSPGVSVERAAGAALTCHTWHDQTPNAISDPMDMSLKQKQLSGHTHADVRPRLKIFLLLLWLLGKRHFLI